MKGKNIKKVLDSNSKIYYYEKEINEREKGFYITLKDTNITPNFTFFIKDGKEYVRIEDYGITLAYYIESNEIWDLKSLSHVRLKLNEQIQKLHDLGIVHIDLHSKNILVDPSCFDLKLIDFDLSRFIDDLCDEDFDDFKTFLPNFCFESESDLDSKISFLQKYEFEMWKYDYF
jgi:serine/threonine protein kinase